MAQSSASSSIARFVGWTMLTVLAVYLINTVLTLGMAWPGPTSAFSGAGGTLGYAQLGLYVLAVIIAWQLVARRSNITLRQDAERINTMNVYLIRALFWAVLLIGLADMVVSFLRVEDLLEPLFGEQMARDLGKPRYRGPEIHMPLLFLGFVIAAVTRGLAFHWLALMIVVAELAIVFTRFVFSYEQAFMGDLVRFWYAALFLFASAHTLYADGHVRVDVFYAGMSPRGKGFINALGAIVMGWAMCWTILLNGLGSKSAIIYSPMVNFEVSQSGFGMYTKYLMAGFLGVFAITMLIQFVSQFMEATADYRGDPDARVIDSPSSH
ncbi:MAG: TRAP transporter small permease subunit [Pseudomonadota bacterium]